MTISFTIYLLTISTPSTFFVGDDNIALQEEHDTLDDVIHDFGVYTDDVDIIYDEEELSDSDDEDYQQPLEEEETNVKVYTFNLALGFWFIQLKC